MPVLLQIAPWVALGLLVVVELVRRRRAARSRKPVTPPSPEVVERLRALIAEDERIQAIRVLRQQTGIGLVEAKDYVDRLPPSGPVPPWDPAPEGPEPSPETVQRARELIAAGKYVSAVKAIRDDTGWGLKEAKEAADRLRGR
jgi:ribosomal protein L7/L12